jgi:hypothetical protein
MKSDHSLRNGAGAFFFLYASVLSSVRGRDVVNNLPEKSFDRNALSFQGHIQAFWVTE